MEQRPVTASQFQDLLPTPPHVSTAWKTFALHVVDAPLHMTATFADSVVGLHVAGTHRVRQNVDGRVVEGRSDPGNLTLFPSHARVTIDAKTSVPLRFMVLFVPDGFLSRVIAEHWDADPRDVEVIWQFLTRDPVVESIMTRLGVEAQNDSPSGQLYAESACEFLAEHIIHSYSSLSTPPPQSSGGLPGGRLKIVLEYIDDALSQPIALRQLAALAGVSARHFERAFRQALGVPPHAYVLGRRVATARDLLLSQRALTVEQIATQVGFSSSSHLASAFRRHTGYSPAIFRRMHFL